MALGRIRAGRPVQYTLQPRAAAKPAVEVALVEQDLCRGLRADGSRISGNANSADQP
jgi:hypothetical protein